MGKKFLHSIPECFTLRNALLYYCYLIVCGLFCCAQCVGVLVWCWGGSWDLVCSWDGVWILSFGFAFWSWVRIWCLVCFWCIGVTLSLSGVFGVWSGLESCLLSGVCSVESFLSLVLCWGAGSLGFFDCQVSGLEKGSGFVCCSGAWPKCWWC